MVQRLNPTFLKELYPQDYFSAYRVFFNEDYEFQVSFRFSCSILAKNRFFVKNSKILTILNKNLKSVLTFKVFLIVPKYAELTHALYSLMKVKDVPPSKRKKSNGAVNGKKIILEWTDEANEAFENLKRVMSGDLVLALPSLEHDFIVNTDASDHAYGAFLEQVVDDKSRIVAYYSKYYTTAQKNYATPEKELLAIVMAIEHWHTYLYGRKFVVYTDHQPLAWLLNKKNPHPRLERWLIRLAQYRFEIKYRKGIENVVADALSRLPNENQVNENINNDYFDTLVAMIEYIFHSKECLSIYFK